MPPLTQAAVVFMDMLMKYLIKLLILSFLALSIGFAAAQENDLPQVQTVQTKAEDGLRLAGDFYPVLTNTGQPRPAVAQILILAHTG